MNETPPKPYVTRGLWETLEGALRAAGKDPSSLTPGDTAPLDHFHTGGIAASEDLYALARAHDAARILDLGGGIGGASRFLAERTGARIACLDLSAAFCSVNQRLTGATGYSGRIAVVCGDATRLPFAPASFDLVWTQQSTMNIADKDALFREIARVLSPGGRYVFQEIMAGPHPGPLELPVAWAAVQEDSHLEPPETIRARLNAAGLNDDAMEDVTETLLPLIVGRTETIAANGPPVLGAHLLVASDTVSMYRGIAASTQLGRIAFVRGVFSAPA